MGSAREVKPRERFFLNSECASVLFALAFEEDIRIPLLKSNILMLTEDSITCGIIRVRFVGIKATGAV